MFGAPDTCQHFSRLGIQKGTSPRFLLHGAYILVEKVIADMGTYLGLYILKKERCQGQFQEVQLCNSMSDGAIE